MIFRRFVNPRKKASANRAFRQSESGKIVLSESGQIIVEYVLLLVVAVALATLITTMIIGRQEGNEGFLITAWNRIVTTIGADHADDIQR